MATDLHQGHFYGGVRRSSEGGGVTLAETVYAPLFAVPKHSHGHPFLCLALAGSFTERFEGRARRFGPRELFYYPTGGTHSESFGGDGGRLFNIQLGQAWVARMGAAGVALPDEFLTAGHDRVGRLAGQIYREFRHEPVASPLALDGYLLAAVGELARHREIRERAHAPRWLLEATDVVHARYRDAIGLAEVAAAVDVHPSHLARVFRDRNGCSIGEYVRRLRVEHARRALLESDQPLARIALDAGFADQSHLTRVFRRALGCTPAQYRRSVRH